MIKLQLLGNLGADAVTRQFGENKVINFSIAVNLYSVNPETKKRQDKTMWVQCSYWRNANQSDEIAKYLLRSKKVYVEGTPSIVNYLDRNGNEQSALNLRVDFIELAYEKKTEQVNVEEYPDVDPEKAIQAEMVSNENERQTYDDDELP